LPSPRADPIRRGLSIRSPTRAPSQPAAQPGPARWRQSNLSDQRFANRLFTAAVPELAPSASRQRRRWGTSAERWSPTSPRPARRSPSCRSSPPTSSRPRQPISTASASLRSPRRRRAADRPTRWRPARCARRRPKRSSTPASCRA